MKRQLCPGPWQWRTHCLLLGNFSPRLTMPTSQWLRVPEPRLLCLVPSCGCQSQGDRISAVPSDPVPTSLRVSSCLPDEWKRGRGQLLSLEEAAEGQPRDHPLLMSSWSLHRDPRGMPCSWPCRSGRCLCAPGRDVVKSQGRTLGGGGGSVFNSLGWRGSSAAICNEGCEVSSFTWRCAAQFSWEAPWEEAEQVLSPG